MTDLDSRCEKCEREIERLRVEFDALQSEMSEVVRKVLARADEILTKVETCNRQMFADLRAQADAGFASLRARIDAVVETNIQILDIAALTVIVEEAGGRVTDLEGLPIGLDSTSILATNGALHAELVRELAG